MRLLRRWPSSITLIAQRDAGEGVLVFAKACELGLEGIVPKRSGSPYPSGASKSWQKTKNPAFVRTRLGVQIKRLLPDRGYQVV
jgi:ATP-dependent DNA ligase